ncbi:MAG: ATP-binding cassette domain-containing protein [SAR202 cluster bacterium]|nr:ATP-binding cassette domain-containing protein [SAR202 cluster bacterium]
MNNVMVEAEGLQKSFGKVTAVAGLSFRVEAGTVLGLLGPNGAGKTTTVRMLATLLPLDGGRASVAGFDVRTQADMVRQSIGLAGQSAAVDENLTGRENIVMFARLYHLARKVAIARAGELIERLGLAELADRPARTYSGGERRRLDIAASLVANPPVLFLDEPTSGLDPRGRVALWDIIAELASQGTTVLLTTQYLEEADRVADLIVVIDRGTVAASGTPDELKDALGRNVLEITVASADDLDRAAAVVRDISFQVATGPEKRALSVGLTASNRTGLEALRLLDGTGIVLEDFQLRRPTLDEVFLTITAGSDVDHGKGV